VDLEEVDLEEVDIEEVDIEVDQEVDKKAKKKSKQTNSGRHSDAGWPRRDRASKFVEVGVALGRGSDQDASLDSWNCLAI
jgi:sulfite reductase beta subunit-like hemoprotein